NSSRTLRPPSSTSRISKWSCRRCSADGVWTCGRLKTSAAISVTKSCARPRSSMNPHDRVRLRHALHAMNAALEFIAGRSRSDLDSDRMLSFALVRAIEVVGEAASKVSAETRAELADLPWAAMVGMRNRLVHAYFDVNHDILWDTVAQAVPP